MAKIYYFLKFSKRLTYSSIVDPLMLFCINSCAQYPIKWQRSSVNVSQESIEEVLDWIYELPCDRAYDEICTIEALVEATEDVVQYNTVMLCGFKRLLSDFCDIPKFVWYISII